MFGPSTSLDLLREIGQTLERNDIERKLRAEYAASSDWRKLDGGPSLLSRFAGLFGRAKGLATEPAA
jgi:hypothetical protein